MARGELFANYQADGFFDEMFAESGRPRREYALVAAELAQLGAPGLRRLHELAERSFRSSGITFTVYEDDAGVEKIFPFDLVPRVITARTWRRLEAGLAQRVTALNHFLEDIYHERRIIRDGAVPADIVISSRGFRRELIGFPFPRGIHSHIAGIDLVRNARGDFLVLEDNLRTPSGVSYMLANRQILKRTWPEVFAGQRIRQIETYTHQLLQNLRWLAPPWVSEPVVAILTPGIYNSAYFEHVYLAKQMGVELVEGSDLIVDQDRVFSR
ncbi:MAG: circularly permuted type 2 ATP-grasp protein, partial [Candidatus Dormibacteraeota bacterium]|nr:circularly permuted type 2 ATP-grasp protein [Candidatus Dormibacteraeota bacterium]